MNRFSKEHFRPASFHLPAGTETPPRAEAVEPPETPLSREKLRGNYKVLLGESTVHLEVLKSIDMFAKSSKPVLISGETGTGKELVARALHAQSPRGRAHHGHRELCGDYGELGRK